MTENKKMADFSHLRLGEKPWSSLMMFGVTVGVGIVFFLIVGMAYMASH